MKKGKVIAIVVCVALVLCGGGGILYKIGVFSGGSSSDKVYVQSVASIMNSSGGSQNQYMGVVESQDTEEISKNSERTIDKVYVKVGDEVAAGAQLFSYDTTDLEAELAQEQLDLEGYANEITGYNAQISDLSAQRDAAPDSEKLDYTTQIQSVQTSIQQSQYNQKSKQMEIDKTKKSIEESVVTCTMDGVVKTINDSGVDANGNTAAYMTILATGDYRIKGTINEQNVWNLTEGQAVIVRSRVDDTTWTGTITKIDTENPESQSSDSGVAYSTSNLGSDTTTSTDYPFYVTLDSTEGLMLGQHLYIEPDAGQEDTKTGIWLSSTYLVMDGDQAYVWAANSKNKLEKRSVTVGEYDENLDEYEITDGLELTDYITYPMDCLYEGVSTVTSQDEVDYDSPMYNQESSGDAGIDSEYSQDSQMTDEGTYDTQDSEMLQEDTSGMEGTE